MFRAADLLVVTKTDLLPYLSFDLELFIRSAREVNPRLAIFPVSLADGSGIADWCETVRDRGARGANA
jgi:hydrogenase nickel incorporation protein HypB